MNQTQEWILSHLQGGAWRHHGRGGGGGEVVGRLIVRTDVVKWLLCPLKISVTNMFSQQELSTDRNRDQNYPSN